MTLDFDPSIDHYKVLGVKPEATPEEIKKAYRRLAKQYHPDSTGGDKAKEARFKEVGQAYDVLGDAQRRAQYDALRSGATSGGRFAGGFPGGGFPGAGGNVFDLGDLFAQMFQGRGGGGRGGNVEFRFTQGGPFGAGGFAVEDPLEAARQARQPRQPREPRRRAQPPAERKIRLSDGSDAVQRGHDIHSDVRLAVDQAILGAVAEVPTSTGTARVKVPPGTSSGRRLRLKGKGARRQDGSHGDHYVTVQIDVPRQVDEEARKLLVQFMQRVKS